MSNSKEKSTNSTRRQGQVKKNLSSSSSRLSKEASHQQEQREYARNLNLVRWGLAFFCLVYAGTYIYQSLEEDVPSFTPPELAFAAVLVGAGLMLSWKLGQKRAEVLSQLAHQEEKEQPPTQRDQADSGATPPEKTNDDNAD
jgi:hypothetical protein